MTDLLERVPALIAPYLTAENIAFAAFALLWLTSMIRCFGHRRLANLARRQRREKRGVPVPISVIVLAENQCHLLRKRLHKFLDQTHPDFEVIVVNMNSQDETQDYLKSLDYMPHLHYRTLPEGAKDISREQLALTLGIRTATKDWVLLTNITCEPESRMWLYNISTRCLGGKNIVVGYTRYRNPHGWAGLRYCFFSAWQQMLNLTHVRKRYIYRAEATNLCYRKEFFLQHKGFATNTTLLTGATDIMVNTYSDKTNTAVCLLPETTMLKDCPRSRQSWATERLFFMETRRHLRKKVTYRLRYALSVLLTWLYTLSLVASLALSLWLTEEPYPLAIAAAVMWAVHSIWRSNCINRTFRTLGEPRLYFSLPLMLHHIARWDFTAWLRHKFTDKKVFRKRFV